MESGKEKGEKGKSGKGQGGMACGGWDGINVGMVDGKRGNIP